MLHSLTNTSSQTSLSPKQCQALVKKYFFTLSRFRRFARKYNNENQFKIALKAHLQTRNAIFDNSVSSIELSHHLQQLLSYSRQLEIFWSDKILF